MEKYTRRRFLQQSFYFSAYLLVGRTAEKLSGQAVSRVHVAPDSHHLFAFGDWGQESSEVQQKAVAQAMQEYVAVNNLRVENLLLLGDNWYGWLFGGSNSGRWKKQFEEMYPASIFPGKCYALLGNHDYEHRPGNKVRAQLKYAARNQSRWTMPAKWYTFSFPESEPLVRFIALDSNYPEGGHFFNTPTLKKEEVAAENAWLQAELAKPSPAPYTTFISHHPIFSNGDHGDTPALIRDWEPLLREHRIHLYLCGHDHDLQHLEFHDSPTSYVISGGGGATLRNLKRNPSTRGPYGLKVAGFTHIEVNRSQMTIRLVDSRGQVLHGFRKYPDGQVALLR